MNRRRYTRRDYAAGVLIAAAVVVLLTVRPWWDLAGFPLAALGCWLALTPARVATPQARGRVMPNPRGRVAPSPVTRAPGGGAILAAAPAWRPVVVARTQGAPPWPVSGQPAAAWDQNGAFFRPPEPNPYPPNRHPSVSAGAWLAGLERLAKGSADVCPPGVGALEAAALEGDLVMVATGEATEVGPEGWVILQPSPRTPPRMVPPLPPAPRLPCLYGDLKAAAQPTARPFKYRAAAPAPARPGSKRALASALPAALGERPCLVCACALEAGGQRCGVCGWVAPELREEQERLADEAEISAVHRTAEYAAELDEQDRDAADFIASREVAGFEWAAALARELGAERRGRQ